jgi:hypothetical protein
MYTFFILSFSLLRGSYCLCCYCSQEKCEVNALTSLIPTKREEEQTIPFCELHLMMLVQKDYLFTGIERDFHNIVRVMMMY